MRERVTFVIHDWGSALGFDWANRHRSAVKGIAYMEAIVRPQGWDHWDNAKCVLPCRRCGPRLARRWFCGTTSSSSRFCRRQSCAASPTRRWRSTDGRSLEPGEGRRPTLTWVRQIPIEGDPADVNAIVAAYADWLATSDVPKLFVKAEPGVLLSGGANLEFARSLQAQTEVTVTGVHFVQEDSPDEIGRAIAGWMRALG